MVIRPFYIADQQSVVALWEDCGLVVSWNDPDRDIERKHAIQPELFLVAVKDQTIIGTAMGGYDGHRGSIYYLAVESRYRGQGVGTRLVKAVSSQLQDLGCPKINIMVRSTNRRVINFYEKLGFAADDVVCMGNRLISDN